MEEGDHRRLDLHSGMPKNLTELCNTVCQAFGMERDFRIQFKDPDFNNEYMNITSVQDIQNRSTIKLVYIQNDVGVSPSMQNASWSPRASMLNAPTASWSPGTPVSRRSASESSQSSDTDDTVILTLSDTELRERPWPREFPIPRFSYDVEMQLQRGNERFRETGSLLKITPGLKSDIMEKLAEEIFQYSAYPQNYQIDDVAVALVKKFPFERAFCLWVLCLDDQPQIQDGQLQDKNAKHWLSRSDCKCSQEQVQG